ncbi:MAG: S8 family serine peptidase [Anaerolineae bacterium]
MHRVNLGRWGLLLVLLVAIVIAIGVAIPAPASGQSPTSGEFYVFLPHLAQSLSAAPTATPTGAPPPISVSIGEPYSRLGPDEAVPGRALVKWREGVDIDTIAQINAAAGVQVVGMVNAVGAQILSAPSGHSTQDIIDAYAGMTEVEYVEPDYIATIGDSQPAGPLLTADELRTAQQTTNDPKLSSQYHIAKMNVPGAWDVTHGDNVVIGIVDTGADFTHPDLSGKFVSGGWDFVNNDNSAQDDQGHGTHVSGIAAAATNNGVGGAGVGYNAKILPVKALDSNGSGSYSAIANGITWATDNGAKIINMSLGGSYQSSTLDAATTYAWNHGVVIIAAAGNSNTSSPSYPAMSPYVIGIGATDENDQRASFSNYGQNADVAAPGVNILSTVMGGQYQAWNGTSMASPNAAGVAALIAAAHPSWTNSQIRSALETTTDNTNAGAPIPLGYGRINAARAVGSASSQPPTSNPTATPTRAPTQPTSTPAPASGYTAQLIDLINQQRAQNGLGPYRTDSRLNAASDYHNRYMRDNNCFAHQCSGEADPFQRMINYGYPLSAGGENIGKGYQTPSDMVNGWMGSSGHRAAILSTTYVDIGCGYLLGPSGNAWDSYWTCDFGRQSGSTTPPTLTPTPTPTATRPATGPTATPTATRTPAPPAATSTPVPTATTAPGGSNSLTLSPVSNGVAWLTNSGTRRADAHLYSGPYGSYDYITVLQFALDTLPANATVVSAQLELPGQSTSYMTVGSSAQWYVTLLDSGFDSQFFGLYSTLKNASGSPVGNSVISTGVGPGIVNAFPLTSAQMQAMSQRKLVTGRLTFRVDGWPPSGYNVMDWYSGVGTAAQPVLRISYR